MRMMIVCLLLVQVVLTCMAKLQDQSFFSPGGESADMLTPRFSPLKILRVKSQHALFGWHSEIFPEFSTCVSQRLVPIRDRYMIGIWLFLLQS
jgi:hypothetical protein